MALAQGALKKLPRETARSFVDGLDDGELADLLTAASAADVAAGGAGNLLYESAAARLRGVDVESLGSAVNEEPMMWRMLTNVELLRAQGLEHVEQPLVPHPNARVPRATPSPRPTVKGRP